MIRAVIYFVLWLGLAFYLRWRSLERDRNPDVSLTSNLRTVGALGTVAVGLTGFWTQFIYGLIIVLSVIMHTYLRKRAD